MPPLVSVVTVNLNDRAGLERTLASIARQTLTDREVIVIDGGSTDGSLDVIRERAAVITDWVSEKDAGIYDAMNKGIRRARGTYVVFLNGGDAFASDDALQRALGAAPPVEDFLYGDAVIEEADGSTHVWVVPDAVDWDYFMRTNLPHQATLFRRDLFDRVGLYDPELRVCADLALFLRAVVLHGATSRHLPFPVAIQVQGGISSRVDGYARLREERQRAKERALGPYLVAHWDQYVAAKRGFLHHTVRTAFRPVARRLRAWTRRMRGKPDALV